jgi:hypothetical protein
MRKVKLLEIHGYSDFGTDDEYVEKYDGTDWDEVSDDAYAALVKWVNKQNREVQYTHIRYLLVTVAEPPVKLLLKQFAEVALEEAAKEEKRRLKREQVENKRNEQKEEREKKKELALLKKLAAKYGSLETENK